MTRFRNIFAIALLCLAPPVLADGHEMDVDALIRDLGISEAAQPVRELPFWQRPEKIHVVLRGNDEERAAKLVQVQQAVGDVEVVAVTYPLSDAVLAEAEVLIARCRERTIRESPKLRWLQVSSHGVDRCMVPEIHDKKFLLTNAQHTSAPPIADHVIAMMTMLMRGLHEFHMLQKQRKWEPENIDFPMREISGKTVLVVGLGGIGIEVAKRAHGLGMRVLGIRASRREGPDYVEYVGLSHELHELASQADVVVNALPLTDATRGIFDAAFFNAAKRGTYFISIGRGESTVTDDLVAALKDGRVSAAGLDVTDPEPPPADHELWGLPNVIITPHVAAETDQGRWRRWLITLENIRRYVNGERMLNVVDLERGY